MSNTLRAVIAVFWCLMTLLCVFFAILGIVKGVALLVASPLLIAVGTGYFNYIDFKFFFGKKK